MGRRLEYEVKTSVRLNMSNPQHVKINDVIQNLDPKIFKSKNQFISNRQIIMRSDIKLPQPFASWSNSL